MKHNYVIRIVAAAIILGTAVMPAMAQQITEDNLGEIVQKANTAADHKVLADYFRTQAKVASDQARKHRAMLVGMSPKSSRHHAWNAHCKRLIQSFENEAAAYLDLAKEQDMLAKLAEQKH